MKCGAKRKNGQPCRAPAMSNGKCRIHGGKTPKGIESVHFKTGRYSNYLPANLVDRYNASLEDENLLALRDEIALLDSRISSIVESVGKSKASAEIWKELRATYSQMESLHVLSQQATARGDKAGAASYLRDAGESLNTIKNLIQRGALEYEQWHGIATLIEQRRKLVETERKRLVDMQQMITVEQALSLVTALMMSVKAHVVDKQALAKINDDIIRLGVVTGARTSIQPIEADA